MAQGDYQDYNGKKDPRPGVEQGENEAGILQKLQAFFADPSHWLVVGIALLLVVAGIFTVKFVGAIRAPDLKNGADSAAGSGGSSHLSVNPETGEEVVAYDGVIDDSNTVHPIVSGDRKPDYYTFLLIGTDASSSNTDTLMVASYDVANQKINLMSIPRDTMVNVSWDIKKINSVYSMSGLDGLKRHIGKLVGFIPDYYVKVDLNAFIEVIDLIGGVDFDVPREMNYDDPAQNLHIHFQPGMQHLTGQQAMELVRWRKNNRGGGGYDDTGRIATQQSFLREAFKQCLSIRNWTKITGYVEIFERDVESDLTVGEMLWFARQAMNLSEDGFETCTAPGNYYASAWSRTYRGYQSYVTLSAREIVQLVNESFNPYLSSVSMANLDIMSINSDGSISSSTGYVADSAAAQTPVSGGSGGNRSDSTEKDEETDTEEQEEPTAENAEGTASGQTENGGGSTAGGGRSSGQNSAAPVTEPPAENTGEAESGETGEGNAETAPEGETAAQQEQPAGETTNESGSAPEPQPVPPPEAGMTDAPQEPEPAAEPAPSNTDAASAGAEAAPPAPADIVEVPPADTAAEAPADETP